MKSELKNYNVVVHLASRIYPVKAENKEQAENIAKELFLIERNSANIDTCEVEEGA